MIKTFQQLNSELERKKGNQQLFFVSLVSCTLDVSLSAKHTHTCRKIVPLNAKTTSRVVVVGKKAKRCAP